MKIRVQAHIETFQRIEQYPDDEDLQKCANELGIMADAPGNLFNFRFFKGPLCSIPTSVVGRRLETLTSELRQLPAQALLPLCRLVNEGKLTAERKRIGHDNSGPGSPQEHAGRWIDDIDAIELKPNFFGIGLNLNHLIKRLGHWWKKRKSQLV